MHFISKARGLEIVIEPVSKRKDDKGRIVYDPGKAIKFKNSHYVTNDPKEIEYLKDYMSRRFGQVQIISEEDQRMISIVKNAIKSSKEKTNPELEIANAVKAAAKASKPAPAPEKPEEKPETATKKSGAKADK